MLVIRGAYIRGDLYLGFYGMIMDLLSLSQFLHDLAKKGPKLALLEHQKVLQWNLSKADTLLAIILVRFIQVSALDRL